MGGLWYAVSGAKHGGMRSQLLGQANMRRICTLPAIGSLCVFVDDLLPILATSTHCAHSFFVNAWDRVINGWGYIHGAASYQKSVTLMF